MSQSSHPWLESRVEFAGMVFPLQASADDYHLGALCNKGHAWPETCQSLRRADPRAPNCRACKSGSSSGPWWLPFVDWPNAPVPAGFRLGKLCPAGHGWENTGLTLRRNGKCQECDKNRQASDGHKSTRRQWYARKKSDPDFLAKIYERNRRWRRTEQGRETRNAVKARHRARLNAQGLTTRGELPLQTPPEARALRRWLQRPSLSPSILQLVEAERCRHWRECPDDARPLRNFYARERQRLRYMLNPDVRTYNREKSRRRKAAERKVWLCTVKPSDIRARYAEFSHQCAYCGAGGDLHMDHFIPLAKKGPHVLGNLIPACQECNYSKRDKDPERWYRAQPFFTEARWRKILRALGKRKCDPGQLSMW